MNKRMMKLVQFEGEFNSAYVELKDYPLDLENRSEPLVAYSINLHEFIKDYHMNYPQLVLDFDKNGVPVGIEILYRYVDD